MHPTSLAKNKHAARALTATTSHPLEKQAACKQKEARE